jgi:hypothetical protein
MLVELKEKWFAPTEATQYAKGLKLFTSGRRYRPGVHEIPDELKDKLPKSAVILEEKPIHDEVPVVHKSLKDFDETRAIADEEVKIAEKAEETRKSYKKKAKKED